MRTSEITERRTGRRGLPLGAVVLLALAALAVAPLPMWGQEGESGAEPAETAEGKGSEEWVEPAAPPLVRFAGSAVLSGDFYRYAGDTAGFTPRRPRSLGRLVVNTELQIGEFFSLPLNLMLTTDETGVVTPWTGQPSFSQYLQNQMNTVGIAPRFGWAQFYLGSHTPQNTGMAFDGSQLFGGGAALRPGKFRLSASAGISQRRVEADTAIGIPGAYEQRAFVGRIGYGDEGGEEPAFALTLARVQDDTTSIRRLTRTEFLSLPDTGSLPKLLPVVVRHPLMPAAIEGNSSSLTLFLPIIKGLTIEGEAALCNYTRDLLSEPFDEEIPVLGSIATQRTSSRIDYALKGGVGYNRPAFGIAVKGASVGPGFVTLGNPYAPSDRQEITLNPRFTLFGGRVNVSGGIGYRINNLSGTKADRTTQVIGGATVGAQITEAFSVDANYNNMGLQSNNPVDTFRLDNIARSFSLTPACVVSGEGGTHAISGQIGLDLYADNNSLAEERNNTSTRTIGGFYSFSSAKIPFSGSAGASSILQEASFGDLTINTVSLNLGYRLFKDAFRPSLTAAAVQSRFVREDGEEGSDRRLSFRLGADWRLSPGLSLNVSASADFNTYGNVGSGGPDRNISENSVQTSLTSQW